MKPSYKELLNNITTFFFDIDGVLTDSSVLILPDGQHARTMSVRDGFALQLAVKKGYRVCIISGGKDESVRNRFDFLGVKDVFLGVSNKIEVFQKYMEENGIQKGQALYMGDDLPDYEVMQQVGVATCPNNAAEEIKAISDYVSTMDGGKGCGRDIIEQTLRVQGNWFGADAMVW